MSAIEIHPIPVLQDNYVFVFREESVGATIVVDPSVAEPVLDFTSERGWKVSHILNTHHHWDHTGGNLEIQKAMGCQIIGPENDRARIPGISHSVRDGETFEIGQYSIRVLSTPGHTTGHLLFYFPEPGILFSGDTLFSLGCGRVFEGTYLEMWESLDRIRKLPPETQIYCGHEYTQANANFALTVEPGNPKLQEKKEAVDQLRAKGESSLPTSLAEELDCNPFLRPESREIRKNLDLLDAENVDVFAELRKRKDRY